MLKNRAIFLDRDGTIIDDTGYLKSPDEMIFYSYSIEALKLLQEHFQLFIVTNQSGVAKGLITVNEVNNVNNSLVEYLKSQDIVIKEVYCCIHSKEDNCSCRKPNPFFLQQAARLYQLDLSKSFIIGDHPSDVQCGMNAGVTGVYLLSGHGQKHREELTGNVTIKENLLEAAKYIIQKSKL